MNKIAESKVVAEVERQLAGLCDASPVLSELPITPLRGIPDLVRLELALRRFAEIHRSKRSKALVQAIRAILGAARNRLRDGAAVSPAVSVSQTPFRDTQPAG